MVKNLSAAGARIGTDPEGFFERNGQIVASEHIMTDPIIYKDTHGHERGRVVRDGIQLELQPLSSHCRANAGNFIQCCLIGLKKYLDENHPDVTVKFYQSVEIPKDYFKTISEDARQLGCAPSLNLYRPRQLGVNPLSYRLRSCGGHLHLGNLPFQINEDTAKRLVRIMDVVVGNTCVLIDRDPGNAVRRRVYGRAGEYRLPKWGLEYRTLSNFWLHAYPLQSLVYALARQSAGILHKTLEIGKYGNEWDAEAELIKAVDMRKIVKAINTNDLELAKENWAIVGPLLNEWFTHGEGINKWTYDDFNWFAKTVQEKGLKHYWDHDPFDHWINKPEGHGRGWESFLSDKVAIDRLNSEKPKKKEAA